MSARRILGDERHQRSISESTKQLTLSEVMSAKNIPSPSSSCVSSSQGAPFAQLTSVGAKLEHGLKDDYFQDEFPETGVDDHATMLRAVKNDPYDLRWASKDLQDDEELVSEAVSRDGSAMAFAGPKSKKNIRLAITALQNDGSALEFLDETLRRNRDLVLLAVVNDGMALKWETGGFNDDEDIVNYAVKQNGIALYYATDRLKKDPDICKQACSNNPFALRFALGIQNDELYVRSLVSQNGVLLQFASPQLKDNKLLVAYAITNPDEGQDNEEKQIQKRGDVVRFASNRLKKDEDIARLAVFNNPYEGQYNWQRNSVSFLDKRFSNEKWRRKFKSEFEFWTFYWKCRGGGMGDQTFENFQRQYITGAEDGEEAVTYRIPKTLRSGDGEARQRNDAVRPQVLLNNMRAEPRGEAARRKAREERVEGLQKVQNTEENADFKPMYSGAMLKALNQYVLAKINFGLKVDLLRRSAARIPDGDAQTMQADVVAQNE